MTVKKKFISTYLLESGLMELLRTSTGQASLMERDYALLALSCFASCWASQLVHITRFGVVGCWNLLVLGSDGSATADHKLFVSGRENGGCACTVVGPFICADSAFDKTLGAHDGACESSAQLLDLLLRRIRLNWSSDTLL